MFNTTIINKTIIYDDTILPIKDLGNNIKISSIKNVSEYSLERCLQVIFESNPEVEFNTIQYSKKDKIVYFYTNKEISTKEYYESKFQTHKPFNSAKEILEEVKKVLLLENCNRSDCVSLYDVSLVLKELNKHYDKIKDKYKEEFKYIIKSLFGENSNIVIYDFDYDNDILSIGFARWKSCDFEKISFKKENNDLYIVKSECWHDKKIFAELYSELSQLYDEYMKYKDYNDYKYSKFNIDSVNSDFGVNITNNGVEIAAKKNNYTTLSLLRSPSYLNECTIECNSSILIETLKGKEEEILKKVFVRIDDCPIWCQRILYEVRQEELEKEILKENMFFLEKQKQQKRKEKQKLKRLELARKVFPFLKK